MHGIVQVFGLLAQILVASSEEACELDSQIMGTPCASLVQRNHSANKVLLKVSDTHEIPGHNSTSAITASLPHEEGSKFAKHMAIALLGVTPEDAASSVPYTSVMVVFGILLAVLSMCALSRRAEDDAFLTKAPSRSSRDPREWSGAVPKKAARSSRPPELSPQSRSPATPTQSLICLCQPLVVPEKVECTLLAPQVACMLASMARTSCRSASAPVSDVNGGPIFTLEAFADDRTDGVRLILWSPTKDTKFCVCRKATMAGQRTSGFRLESGQVSTKAAQLKILDSGYMLTADPLRPFRFQGRGPGSINALDDDGKLLAYSDPSDADSSGIARMNLRVGPNVDAGLMVLCYAAIELLEATAAPPRK
mmetsp:Transcript_22054/g.41545  ORF Transcript_22054/g.41545 Transcript_22054/m.41545 type:complete len:366 (-) Transcript_22054:217-1314(-)